jgi:hypothetical protein
MALERVAVDELVRDGRVACFRISRREGRVRTIEEDEEDAMRGDVLAGGARRAKTSDAG